MNPITIDIKHSFPKFMAEMDAVRKDIADRATVRALNTTIRQGEAEMAREISRAYRIKQATVRERLSTRPARKVGGAFKLEVVLEATKRGKGRSMNLIAFHTGGGRRLKSGERQQLKFQIRRDGGRKQITGAFIGNKGRTVFIREGKGRLPIKALNTIDVVQMFNVKSINAAVQQLMLDRFEANWRRELHNIAWIYK